MRTHDLRIFLAGLAWWCGTLVTLYLGLGPTVTILAIACLGPGGIFVVTRHARVGPIITYWAPTIIVLTFTALIASLVTTASDLATPSKLRGLVSDHATVTVRGHISGYPTISDKVYREITIDQIHGRGITITTDVTMRAIGDTDLADIDLHTPFEIRGRLAPADQPSRMHAWLTVTRMNPGELTGIQQRIATHRHALMDNLPDGPAAGLVPGLGIGDDSRLPPENAQALQQSNLTHLTAVSGAHISMICAVILGLIGGRRPGMSVAACAVVLALLWVATGGAPSVTRASLMGVVTLAGILSSRPTSALPALGVAIVAMLLIDPRYANDYGFVLSVTATATILLAGPPATRALRPLLGNIGAHMCAIPVVAHLGCAPIIATLNPSASMWSALANLLCAPVIPLGTISSLLALIVAPVSGIGEILAWISSMIVSWIDIVARACMALPGAEMPPGSVVVIYLALIGIGLGLGRGMIRWAHLGIVAVTGTVLSVIPRPIPDWDMVQCDVGQGHATLIKDDQRTYLIDTGSPGERLDECIKDAGADIDVLIVTHAHDDHYGNAEWVVRTFNPIIWAGPGVADVIDLELTKLYAGDTTETLRVLWPETDSTCVDSACTNNQSLVIMFNTRQRVLVAGDIEQDVQCRLATDNIAADVVLIPHHGSPSACPEFADAVSAPLAILGVGDNTFGHPHPHTVDMYSKHGTVMSTMDNGDIYLSFDMEY